MPTPETFGVRTIPKKDCPICNFAAPPKENHTHLEDLENAKRKEEARKSNEGRVCLS